MEDQAVVIDKGTGHVKRTITFSNFLKPGSQKSGSWSDEDWFHCNAVWYDEHSNSLTFSGRHINAMVNIDFDTEELNWIIWILKAGQKNINHTCLSQSVMGNLIGSMNNMQT